VLVPAARKHRAVAAERQDQLLARGVQPAGRTVEPVEDDALNRGVEAARAALARLARVRNLRRRLVERALG
jgi:hypothetical protein